jgi:catechol 2,3-dioxygenase-like lactoylglutathione lyase family enzyme
MYEPHFHVGILVKDIEAAAADFTALLGVKFEPVHGQQVGTGETVRLCYSLQGPPYLELREMTGSGIWSPDQGEGLHHVGVSDPGVPGRCAAFGEVDVITPGRDGSPLVAMTRPSALHGVRVEYLDATVAAQFLGYLRSR